MRLADYVIQTLADRGVKHVFLLTGGGAMHLNDALAKCPAIEYVCNLHEQACAVAAESYAKVTNNLGVAMVTSGPGGTNALTGLAGAWLDSTPCLFLSGQVKRADLKGASGVRMLGSQEIDIVSLAGHLSKYAVTITDPASIRYHLEKALHLATTGRKGPAWLDIPLDIQAMQIEPSQLEGFVVPESAADPAAPARLADEVRQTLKLLAAAERPVILVGNGVYLAGGRNDFLRLVEALQIPVLTTWLGMDAIGDDHPLFAGRPGAIAPRGANFTLQNSDLLLIIGARMDMALTAYAHDKLARAAKKIYVDIDPAEIRKMKTPIHIPIVADARAFIVETLRQLAAGEAAPRVRHDWIARCRDWKAKYPVVQPEHVQRQSPVSVYHFSRTLSELLTGDDIIAPGSSGFACEIFYLVFKVINGQRILHNRGTGAMGLGIPSAIGACLGGGRRRTICVDGDGGFQMNIQELATVAHLQLPIKFFVVNNDGYASIRTSQSKYFGRVIGADKTSGVALPDVCKVAAAYNVATSRISQAAGMIEHFRDILARPGPHVCEVIVPSDEPRGPRVDSMQKPDGTMVSKPLEDLWPFLDREEFLSNMIIPPLPE